MTDEYISDPAHPVEEYREPTKRELKHGIDSLAELAAARYDEVRKLRARNAILEGRLLACHKERDDYQAVSVRLLGELKAAQDMARLPDFTIMPPAHETFADKWRQQE